MLRVVRKKRGDRLGSHIYKRIANDINDINGGKGQGTKIFAGNPVIHGQKRESFDGKTDDHKYPDFAEAGIYLIIDESKERVGNTVENTGSC